MTFSLYSRRIMKNSVFFSNLMIVLISMFYLLNAKNGHDWGDDFSMYILNANNIVNGAPYSQTNYVYNTDISNLGPQAYPPVFPLMLVPFISIWGINLQVLKLPGIFCFIGALFYLNIKILPKNLSFGSKFIFLTSVGLFPFFFYLSESILSDFPFLLLSLVALERINHLLAPSGEASKNLGQYMLAGLWIYLAYGTRSIGLVLLPIAFVLAWMRYKKIPLYLFATLMVSLVFIVAQSLLIPQTGAYLDLFPKAPSELFQTLLVSTGYYFTLFAGVFSFNNLIIQGIVFLIMLEGFVIGLLIHLKKGISSFDLFFLSYFVILLVWPSYQSLRFLVPILPLYFLYIVEGFDRLLDLIKLPWIPKIITLIVLLSLIFYYANDYITSFPQPISDIEKKETQELFQFIRMETRSDDLITFYKPRVMALFTQRKSVAIAIPPPNGDTLARMEKLGVNIVILRKNYDFEHQQGLSLLITTYPGNFKLLYENSEFQVFRTIYNNL
jgi:hypothetical protein